MEEGFKKFLSFLILGYPAAFFASMLAYSTTGRADVSFDWSEVASDAVFIYLAFRLGTDIQKGRQ